MTRLATVATASLDPRSGASRAAMEARGLAVGRTARPVLQGIDLDVAPGERVALVGRNGSGKTTLLRALAGIDPPLAGTLRWLGGELPRGAARVARLGVLFQGDIAPAFSVRHVVTLGLGLDGPPSPADRARVEETLDRFDLGPLAERPCNELSAGEARRVALARGLVASPRILLLDEATNHLDPFHRASLLSHLDRLRPAVTVVLATHDLEAAASCDRVALLHGGRLEAQGSPGEVLSGPLLSRVLGVATRGIRDPEDGALVLRVIGPVGAA